MTEHPIVEFYNCQVRTYDDMERYSYWEILYAEFNCWIKKHLNGKNLTLTDLGCGTGLTSEIFLEQNNMVFGVDRTPQFLKKYKQRCNCSRFIATESDMTNLPFKDNSFDGIISLGTIDNIEDIDKVISEVKRICKPDGVFIFDIPSTVSFDLGYFVGLYGKSGFVSAVKGLTQKKVMFEWLLRDDNNKVRKNRTFRYKPDYFEKILEPYGFEIIEKRGVHISTMLIPERFQANSTSPILGKINNMLNRFDNLLNKISFMRDRSVYIMYACKMKK